MDFIARKKLRDKKREIEEKRQIEEEAVLKEQVQGYTPTTKKITVIAFFLFIFLIIYLGYNSEITLHNECKLILGLECGEPYISQTMISFEASNLLKEDLNVTMNIEGCENEVTNYIRPNSKAVFEFKCDNSEQKLNRDILITYTGYSGLPHDATGKVQGTIK